ncbi:MAG TPA: c-type cytochrome [Armatimonadota bacterium]|nr:c-type cytochrome [Armatimonadota bacterium]
MSRALIGLLVAGLVTAPVLSAMAAPAKKKAPAKPAAKADAKAGQAAFKTEGCTGCHKTQDYPTGGEVGPDLSAVGKEKKAAEIAAYIKKPKAGSVMPAFKGPQAAVDNMTAYLVTQK